MISGNKLRNSREDCSSVLNQTSFWDHLERCSELLRRRQREGGYDNAEKYELGDDNQGKEDDMTKEKG
jgi:hypothetical protein